MLASTNLHIIQPRNIGDVLAKLAKVKSAGAKRWKAACPVAKHKTPSKHLSVTDAGDKALVKCFPEGNHTYEDIRQALGFDTLTYSRNGDKSHNQSKEKIAIATYDYQDATGTLLFQVVRYHPKDFSQRRPNSAGGWVWNLDGITPVLYHLPDILTAVKTAPFIIITEGEKDASNVWLQLAMPATCNPMGAGKWRDSYSESLVGAKSIIIIAHKDAAGRSHAQAVAKSLYGKVGSVKVIEMPGDSVKDISDWLDQGGTIEALDRIVTEAPEYHPVKTIWSHSELMSENFQPIRWLVDGLVVDEGLTVFGGKKKRGKSWFCLQTAQSVASGSPVLGRETKQAGVILFALEDGEKRLKERLIKQNAPLNLPITYVFQLTPLENGGLDELRSYVQQYKPGMVIIDTLAAAKTGKTDENAAGAMADIGNALRRLAQALHIAVVVAAHHGKMTGGNPGDDIRGSSAISAAADVNLGLYKTEDIHLLKAEGRDIEETELRIEFDAAETWAWQLLGDARQLARQEADRAIFDALEVLGEADAGMIAKETGKDRSTINTNLKRLRTSGMVNYRNYKAGRISKLLYTIKNTSISPTPPTPSPTTTPPTPPTTFDGVDGVGHFGGVSGGENG